MTCLSFFLVEAFPQLADTLVHESHFHVALVQKLLLLLQLAVLLLVQFVPYLKKIYFSITSKKIKIKNQMHMTNVKNKIGLINRTRTR